jgi:hypothetical protein
VLNHDMAHCSKSVRPPTGVDNMRLRPTANKTNTEANKVFSKSRITFIICQLFTATKILRVWIFPNQGYVLLQLDFLLLCPLGLKVSLREISGKTMQIMTERPIAHERSSRLFVLVLRISNSSLYGTGCG